MRRAVLDPGVLVSALIKPTGTPAKLLVQADGAGFELIVSPLLLLELESVLLRTKFRRYATVEEVARISGRPCSYLPLASDVLKLTPYPNLPERSIDVTTCSPASPAPATSTR